MATISIAGRSTTPAHLVPVDDRATYEAAASARGPTLLQQGWAYGEAVRRRGQAVERRLLVEDGAVIGAVQVLGRRVALGHVALWHAAGGPVIAAEASTTAGVASLATLRRRFGWRRGALFVATPGGPSPDLDRQRLAAAGFSRAMTGHATARLDLRTSEADLWRGLKATWRQAVRRGLPDDVVISLTDARNDPFALAALLDAAAASRAERGYGALPESMVRDIARGGSCLLATASRSGELVAGLVLPRHGATATYQIGWLAAEARRSSLHAQLLWGAIGWLKRAGAHWLDVGGLDVPPGITRFKLASGATPVRLAGSWA